MKLKLSQLFTLLLLGLAGLLALLIYAVLGAMQSVALLQPAAAQGHATREIGERVARFLEKAPTMVRQVEFAIKRQVFDPRDLPAMEAAFAAQLLADEDIAELTLTYGEKLGFDPDGQIQLAERPLGQLSVERTGGLDGAERLWSRHLHKEDEGFVADRRDLLRPVRLGLLAQQREKAMEFFDPTLHPSFTAAAREHAPAQLTPSDLHWSQLDADAALPVEQRRAEVSVQQVLTDARGEFVGVLRIGLLTPRLRSAVPSQEEALRLFLCDETGRLISRGQAADRFVEQADDLRIAPVDLAPALAAALHRPALRGVAKQGAATDHFRAGGEDYLAAFRALPGTPHWVAGVVAPRSLYFGRLGALRWQLFIAALVVMAVAIVVALLLLRAARRARRKIIRQTLKLKELNFTPSSTDSHSREVSDILVRFEETKVALRSLGKYAPLDLVRRLQQAQQEPVPGGELIRISVLAASIRDLAAHAERLPPPELAGDLAHYLTALSHEIQQECKGTLEQAQPDSVRAIWNAPAQVPDHAALACRAALRCREAGGGFFAARFGLHLDRAPVGHFGPRDRLSYTAIGGTVQLAARLRDLNGEFGTDIIASERIVEQAGDAFAFRLLDLIKAEGYEQPLRIYELRGEKDAPGVHGQLVADYEEALGAYFERDFAMAVKLLKIYPDDGPSRLLLERCRQRRRDPPPPWWRGAPRTEEK